VWGGIVRYRRPSGRYISRFLLERSQGCFSCFVVPVSLVLVLRKQCCGVYSEVGVRHISQQAAAGEEFGRKVCWDVSRVECVNHNLAPRMINMHPSRRARQILTGETSFISLCSMLSIIRSCSPPNEMPESSPRLQINWWLNDRQ
jgi:hypothetical protein